MGDSQNKAAILARVVFSMKPGPKPTIPRRAVLELHNQGKSIPAIARELGISKSSVRRVPGVWKPREKLTTEERRRRHLERARRNMAKANAKKKKRRAAVLGTL
jgi:transposase